MFDMAASRYKAMYNGPCTTGTGDVPDHVQRAQVTMYNGLVERCFANCVNSFQSKTLDAKEERVQPCPHPPTLHPLPTSL